MKSKVMGVWCLCAAMATPVLASDLGTNGRLQFSSDAIWRLDFEDPTVLAPLLRKIISGSKSWTYTAVTASDLQPFLISSNDALEGQSVLHWKASDGEGLAIFDSTTFATLVNQRVIVSFWGRAEGMEPYLGVTYGEEVDISTTKTWAWARVPAIRTGRETSDGWVEYSTGAIDGAVLSKPIHDIILSARIPSTSDTALLLNASDSNKTDAISIDAVEIRPATGTPATGVCTVETADGDCGSGAECLFGQCVDSAMSWHPVPPLSMQQEIVARVVQWATHVLGDRSAAPHASASWVAATMALASDSATPKSFWGGLNQQFVALRDSHTHLGAPDSGISTPFAIRPGRTSGTLDVCFGPTKNDLGDGKLAFVVWDKVANSPSTMMVGDVLSTIDGMDPKQWMDAVYPRYIQSLPVDPSSDWAPEARDLASLISKHAKTITVRRCTSGGSCTEQPAIDVAATSLAAIGNGKYSIGTLTCSPRFIDTVSGDLVDSGGGNAVISTAIDSTTVAIEFDGFQPTSQPTWMASVDSAFALPHDHVLVDAREGFGGKGALGRYLFQQFRGSGSPAVLILAARGSMEDPDDSSLFAFDWSECATQSTWECQAIDIAIYQPTSATPPGLNSKVAWLNTDDVSNNDMVPLLLKGRSNLQIFAPFPTYGAYGSDVPIPALMPNWHAGTIAASDGRLGTSIATAEMAASCQSGHGVVPDQVVTQTLSDVLAGRDTIVQAAENWLAQ